MMIKIFISKTRHVKNPYLMEKIGVAIRNELNC